MNARDATAVLEALPLAVLMAEPGGRVTYANAAAHALFSHAKLQRPSWLPSEAYVAVRAAGGESRSITIGAAPDSTIRLL